MRLSGAGLRSRTATLRRGALLLMAAETHADYLQRRLPVSAVILLQCKRLRSDEFFRGRFFASRKTSNRRLLSKLRTYLSSLLSKAFFNGAQRLPERSRRGSTFEIVNNLKRCNLFITRSCEISP